MKCSDEIKIIFERKLKNHFNRSADNIYNENT